ncbi:MAG: hypothetical protein JWP27_1053 [Flaviaesturariibacter sp.]|nr:hypothetical protein [Flaviaesturariibacter sp.]
MKYPKVLLLGYNFASVMNSLAIGFEELGVPYKALSFDLYVSKINQYSHVECVYPRTFSDKLRINWYRAKGLVKLVRYLAWCDVIHIFYDTAITGGRKELALFRLFKKKKYINFIGSDVRNPNVSLAVNPYFADAFHDPGYEYKQESEEASNKIQSDYANEGFEAIHWATDIYNNASIFKHYYNVPLAAVNHHSPKNREQAKDDVLIIHSPTAPVAKGTQHVMKAIETLRARNITNFRFQLLKDISNDQYQQLVADADILVDQMIWGGYGIASVQALALGKVVVCYLLPQRVNEVYGKDCPVVNANIDDLADVLEELIGNFEKRKEISKQSVEYYRRMHSPAEVARHLVAVYTGTIKPTIATNVI